MVDDATSTGLALFAEEETTWAVADTLRAWVETYGIPRALYVDWKNVYHYAPTARQQSSGRGVDFTVSAHVPEAGDRVDWGNSPQAKGRVERSHGIHQDRLIKKMRLRKIRNYQEAKEFLHDQYLPQHNARYAVVAAQAVDFHEASPKGLDLEEVFCLEEERTVGNDWVVRYQHRFLQIEASSAGRVAAGSVITVRQRRDGKLQLLYGGQALRWSEDKCWPQSTRPVRVHQQQLAKGKWKPPANHPWRRWLKSTQALRG